MERLSAKHLKALRIAMIGFFIAFAGFLLGMIDQNNPAGMFFKLGSIVAYCGLFVFIVGFFWLLVMYLERLSDKQSDK
jgi:hypothetical protein